MGWVEEKSESMTTTECSTALGIFVENLATNWPLLLGKINKQNGRNLRISDNKIIYKWIILIINKHIVCISSYFYNYLSL